MSTTKRPPLTPAESRYHGLDAEGWHHISWPSRSEEGLRHTTRGSASSVRDCTCKGWHHRGGCAHALGFHDALRHHLDPPPADLGGARCEACDEPLAPGESGTCRECRTAFAHFEGYLDHETPAPGGAVGGPPELAGLTECEDRARDERKRRHAEAMIGLYGES